MNQEFTDFAARLRGRYFVGDDVRSLHSSSGKSEPPHVGSYDNDFSCLALELFALQFKQNVAYQKICEAGGLTPDVVEHWTQIPTIPTSAFKELELSCLPAEERTAVFHSSGTTEQRSSRHFHCVESLAVYESSLWRWFERNVLRSAGGSSASYGETRGRAARAPFTLICLTPPPEQVPHSSLVHMFETIRQKLAAPESVFVGKTAADGTWALDVDAVMVTLQNRQSSIVNRQLILGTAFSFVHLLDFLSEQDLRFQLPDGSCVMETGGYKNRSRTIPKGELHALITERLGVPTEYIVSEYGMSELSSQAYDGGMQSAECGVRNFYFPPWARVQIISPETGLEVTDGKTGLIRVFDLANVFSVMAVQTEDLGIRRADGFELIGRAQMAEPRGCSLMTT